MVLTKIILFVNVIIVFLHWSVFIDVFYDFFKKSVSRYSLIVLLSYFLFIVLLDLIGEHMLNLLIACIFNSISYFISLLYNISNDIQVILYFITGILFIAQFNIIEFDTVLYSFIRMVVRLYIQKSLYYNILIVPVLIILSFLIIVNIVLYRQYEILPFFYTFFLFHLMYFYTYLIGVFLTTDMAFNISPNRKIFTICVNNTIRVMDRAIMCTLLFPIMMISKLFLYLLRLFSSVFIDNRVFYTNDILSYSYIFTAYSDIQYEKIYDITYNVFILSYFFISDNFHFIDYLMSLYTLLVGIISSYYKIYVFVPIYLFLYLNMFIFVSIKNILNVLFLYDREEFRRKYKSEYDILIAL